MCGLTGFLGEGSWIQTESVTALLQEMAGAIAHRGPDAFGSWDDESAAIALAHRRLSILDLSPAGSQPMISACGRYVVAFNGEIYNHSDLRSSLESTHQAPLWRGHSDTETLLAGFSAWGIVATLERCVGMFALAVWDKAQRVLTLARDRLGEKPLYYGWQGRGGKSSFLFGSDLLALRKHPAFQSDINREALCLLMRYNYINGPHSIYKGIYKLLPGHYLTVSLARPEAVSTPYWSLSAIAEQGVASPYMGSDVEAVDTLEHLLKDAVRRQMVADVPLGAFLSGGIDSSTIVALMQMQSSRPVKTFTIGFSEEGYNEAVHAKAVAKHLGTEHTELYITPRQALDVIPQLSRLYSEPFADSSQIPTFLVSQLARRQVTVSLSGDAGDELFGGYNRYVLARNLGARVGRVPKLLRVLAAFGIRALPADVWSALLRPLLPASRRAENVGDKLYKGASILAPRYADELYHDMVSQWSVEGLVLGAEEPASVLCGARLQLAGLDSVERMMALDALTYLPDDILVKTDRAAMGVSLEGRVPFLDHRVVEFAWRLPQHMKLRDGVGKWVLRQVLYRHVPKELIERPKMGFGVPIDAWLRGSLRDWAETLLDESRLRQEGFLNPAPIRRKWKEHLSGHYNWQHYLWSVLMFQAWLEDQSA